MFSSRMDVEEKEFFLIVRKNSINNNNIVEMETNRESVELACKEIPDKIYTIHEFKDGIFFKSYTVEDFLPKKTFAYMLIKVDDPDIKENLQNLWNDNKLYRWDFTEEGFTECFNRWVGNRNLRARSY